MPAERHALGRSGLRSRGAAAEHTRDADRGGRTDDRSDEVHPEARHVERDGVGAEGASRIPRGAFARAAHRAEGDDAPTDDERNFGMSGAGNGGLTSAGRYEIRDVIGALQYVRSRAALSDLDIALFSRCNGANAALFAMATQPAFFDDVRCLIACQPLSARPAMVRNLQSRGLEERIDQLEHECRLVVSLAFDQMSPIP